jgi:acyl dehydratase
VSDPAASDPGSTGGSRPSPRSGLLTDGLRAWIGREAVYTAPEELGRASIRYFARAVGDDNPIYTDEEAARAAGYDDVVAPPTLVCETNQYMDRRRDADGYIGHSWDLPITGCRLVRGGHSYTFAQPVRPDDVITARWRLVDIIEKRSRSGAPMLLVTSVVTYTNQHGETLATNTETTIYQPLGEDS